MKDDQGRVIKEPYWPFQYFGTDRVKFFEDTATFPRAYIYDGPALAVTPVKERVPEGYPYRFRVTLDTDLADGLQPAAADVSFDWKTVDGGKGSGSTGPGAAIAGKDYTAQAATTVTIPAGETSVILEVATQQDTIDEPDQHFTVALENPSGAVFDVEQAVGAIRDDDRQPYISIADAQGDEGQTLEFAVSLSHVTEKNVTVDYVTEDVTATPNDYVPVRQRRSIVIPPGQTTPPEVENIFGSMESQTIRIRTYGDRRPESDETFKVQLGNVQGARHRDPTGIGTIRDDDKPAFSIADVTVEEPADGATGAATLTVTLEPAQDTPVTIQWQTAPGIGDNNHAARSEGPPEGLRFVNRYQQDYNAVSATNLTFAAGETEKQVSVTLRGDDIGEVDENFRVVISGDATQYDFPQNIATVTIQDTDAFTFFVDPDSPTWVNEGESIDVNVLRTDASAEESQLTNPNARTSYRLLGCFVTRPNDLPRYPYDTYPELYDHIGNASIGGDVVADTPRGRTAGHCHQRENAGYTFGGFNFDRGVYQQKVTFEAKQDGHQERNETFTFFGERISGNPATALRRMDHIGIRGPLITITIVDDDTPQLSIADQTVEESAGEVTLTINLSEAVTDTLKVELDIEGQTAQEWVDFTPNISTEVTFNPGETSRSIVIPISDDNQIEPDETFTVTLLDPPRGVNVHPGGRTATVTISASGATRDRSLLLLNDRVVPEGDPINLDFRLSPADPANAYQALWEDVTEGVPHPAKAGNLQDYTREDKKKLVRFDPGDTRPNPNPSIAIPADTVNTVTIQTQPDRIQNGDRNIGIDLEFTDDALTPRYEGRSNLDPSGRPALITIRDDPEDSSAVGLLSTPGAASVYSGDETRLSYRINHTQAHGDVTVSVQGDDAQFFTVPDPDVATIVSQRLVRGAKGDQDGDDVYEVILHLADEDGNTRSYPLSVTVEQRMLTLASQPICRAMPENGGTCFVIVQMEQSHSDEVTVTLAPREANPAYTLNKTELTFAPTLRDTQVGQAVILTAVNDDVDNADDQRAGVLVVTASGSGYTPTDEVETAIIVTDDDTRGLTAPTTTLTVTERGNAAAYTLVLDSEPTDDVTIAQAITGPVTLNPATLTFTPSDWDQPQAVTVSAVDDDDVNLNGRRDATIIPTANGGDYVNVVGATVSVTVLDDDRKMVNVSKPELAFSENGGSDSYDVTLSHQPTGGNVVVTLALTGDDPGAATAQPATLTFSPTNWETAQSVTISGVDDDVVNEGGARAVTVEHQASGGGYDRALTDTVAVTVQDDDALGVIFDPASRRLSVNEGSTTTYRIKLASKPDGNVAITFTSMGPITHDQTSGMTFTPTNWSDFQEITVTGVDDSGSNNTGNNPGGRTTARIDHEASGGGYDDVEVASVQVSVIDNHTFYYRLITGADVTVTEGETFTFEVQRNDPNVASFRVRFPQGGVGRNLFNYGMAGESDYEYSDVGNLVEFDADDKATFQVRTKDDDIHEPVEAFVIALWPVSAGVAAFALPYVVGIIEDDDDLGVTLTPEELQVSESGSATYTVALTSQPTGGDVTINLTPTGDITLNQTSLTFTSANWNVAQPVTVNGVDDSNVNCVSLNGMTHGTGCPADRDGGGAREATITHTVSAMGTDYEGVAAPDLAVDVLDDELPQITVRPGAETTEGEDLVFTLALATTSTRAWHQDITFEAYTVAASGVTHRDLNQYPLADYPDATPGQDYTQILQSNPVELTLPAGEESVTYALPTTEDSLDEHDEAVALFLDSATNAETSSRRSDFGIIQDDDDPPVVSVGDATAVTEGNDPAVTTDLTFPLQLTASSGRDAIIHYTLGGTATADADYTDPAAADETQPTVKAVTIQPGILSGSVTIPVLGDLVHEGDLVNEGDLENEGDQEQRVETVVVTLSDTSSATVSTETGENTGKGDIIDDDAAPTAATLTVSPASVGEAAGATTVTVTATLDGATTFGVDTTVRVTIGKDGDSAVSDTDYTGVSAFDLTIKATESSVERTFTLTPTNDALDEDDETLTVHATADGLTIPDATLTITDDDDPPALSIADAAAVTEGSAAEFTVTLTPASGRVVTVQWSTADDESEGAKPAESGTDYDAELGGQTITFNPGDTSAQVSITTFDDTMHEPAETFLAQLARPDNATLATADATGTGTINDDDPLPTAATVSLSPAKVGEEDGDTAITVTVALDGASTFAADQTISISVGQAGDSAASDTDYTGVAAFDLTLSAAESSGEQAFTLTPTSDDVDEDNETLTVAGTVAGLTISNATLTIEDDDTRGVKVSRPTLTLEEGGSAGTYTVVLEAQPTDDVTVALTLSGDDTGAVTVSDSLTFTPSNWKNAQTVTVTPVNDDTTSPNGRRVVTIEHAVSGADYGSETAADVVVTVNEDEQPELTIDDVTVAEGDAAEFTITLAPVWNQDVTVQWSTGDDGTDGASPATAGVDYTAQTTAQTVTIAAGSTTATVSVQTTEDQLDEADETFLVNLSAPTVAILGTASSGKGAITDDDASPTVSVGDATAVIEGNDPATTVDLEFPLTLAPVSGREVTVTYTLGGTATAGNDYTDPATKTVTIAAGSTTGNIVIPVKGDLLAEGNETVIVTLSGATNANVSSVSGENTGTGTITDDDTAPTTATLSVSPASVDEDAGATTVTVTATLAGSVTLTADTTVRVTVGKDADTAVSATDYAGVSAFDLTITAGQSSGEQTFSLTPTNDTLDEDDEKLTVHATADGLSIADAEITITDADALPELTVANASVAEGEKAMFTVTLTPASGRDVTVQWTTGDDGTDGAVQATADTDYTAQTAASTLTIAAGDTSGTIEVQTTQDTLAEGNETFAVNLASPTNATLGTADSAIGTITDDDTAPTTATLAVSPASVDEDAGATTVTVTATLAGSVTFTADTTVRVTIGKDADTAVSDTDYTGVSAFDLTITAGQSSGQQTFTLTPTNDALDEDDETLTVHATADGLTIADAEITITDADALPELTIADASVAEGEKAMFTVTLTPASGRDVSVQWTTGDDGTDGAVQATADTDYTAQTTATTLTIAAGDTSGTIEVQTTQDTLAEGSETFAVNLAAPSNATLGTADSGIGTITDDDTAPTTATLAASPASVDEDAGATTVTVTATLAGSVTLTADTTVRVMVGQDGDSAVSDTDYTGVSAFDLTITAGQSSGQQTFTLTPTNDTLDEDDEKLTVHATADGLTIADAEITITDADALPELTIANASVAEGEKAMFTVTLTPASGRDVTVQWTTGDDGTDGAVQATADTDYTAQSAASTLTIAAGDTSGTIEVQTTQDTLAEGDETFAVNLASPTNATLGTADSGIGAITDDDTTPSTAALSVSPSSVGEDDGATTVTVTATLAGSVTLTADTTVRVTVGKDADSAVSDTDYTGVSAFDLTITAGQSSGEQTFTLTPTDDALDEDDETLTVHATADGLTIADAEITITDADALPELTIADASVAEGEKAMFTVTLTPASGRDVTVEWTTGDDPTENAAQATADTDYTAQSAAATLTIAAGDTSGTIEVQTTQDTLAEADETFAVNLASPTNATLGTADSGIGTITDDDTTPSTAALSVSPSSVGEDDGATTITVTATLAGSVTLTADTTVRVTVGKDGDSAVSATDYTGVSAFDLTITAGQSSGQQTFTLTPTNDTLDEDDETLTVHATADGLTIADAEITITDADALPELTIADASVAEGEKAMFTVTLTPASGRDVTVQWTTGDDGTDGAVQATADTDYTAQSAAATLTIAAGDTSGTIEVQTTQDTLAEGDETFAVNLAAPTNATLGTADSGIGTITDDDTAPATAALSVSPSSVGEDDGATTVTVTATLAGSVTLTADTTVRVTIGKDGDSAVSDTDYTGVSAFDLTITAGQSSGQQTFTLTPTNDTLDEDDETLTVHATANGLTIADAAVTITDADALPELTIANASVAEGEKAMFTVTLTPVSGRDVTVQWTTGDDGTDGASQATADTDYTAQSAAATLTIAAGDTSGTIEVQTTQDTLAEGNETFAVNLASPTNATLGAADSGIGTITDDDTAPATASLAASPASVDEDAGATTVTVTATLAGSVTLTADTTVRVMVGQDGDSAVSDTDYTGVSAFDLTITAGQTSGQQTFSLTPTNDTLDEDDETLTVHATANGLTIADAAVTITDADALPELTIANASVAEGEKAMFTVTLTPVSGRDVTVQWTTGDDGTDGAVQATADTDYTAQSAASTLTIAAGDTSGTIEVQTTQDTLAEGSETFAVNLAAPTNATLGAADSGIGTITDDDTAPATAALSVSPSSVGEDDGATTVTVTATLAGSVTLTADTTVRVTIGKDGDTAVSATDYTGVSAFDLTITAGQSSGQGTFSLTPTNDTLDEDDETLTVHATADGLTIADATVTITDADALPELTIADASVAEGEKAMFTVTLTPASGRDVTVQWTTGDDPTENAVQATADTDYTAQSAASTLTIAAGDTSGTIEVQTTQDTLAEGSETFVVNLASPTNATLGTADSGIGTITDDDTTPSTAALSVSPSSVGEDDGATTVTVTATLAGSVTLTADTTVRVMVGQDGDSAVSDTDYTGVSPFDLTITAGQTSGQQTFSLTPTNDALDEDDETLTVHATADGLTIADAEITITDADALPELTVADASVAEGGKAMFTVTLTPVSGRDVTVEWTTGDDPTENATQATADTDYTAQSAAATLTIAAGDTSGTIEVQTTQDTLAEGSETFVVNLASPTNATLGTADSAIGTITDDDTTPTTAALSVSPSSVGEDDGATTITVTATLAGSVTLTADATVSVMVGKDGDSAVSDTDYTGVSAFDLTITAGETSGEQTFTLTPTNDTLDEDDEKLTVHATANGLTIADAEVTITDADASPTVSLGDATAVIEGNNPATTVDLEFPLTLAPVSGRDVTVTYTLGGTATANSDYNNPPTKTAIIGAGAATGNIVIPVKGDLVDEGNETVIVTLSGATNANVSSVSGEDTGTGTITDDDAGRDNRDNISVSIGSNGAVVEGDWLHFEIALSEPLTEAAQIPIDLEFVTADDYHCLPDNDDNLCGSDLVPHKSMLGPEYAGIRDHSEILRAQKPWLVKVLAGDTSASGSIGTRNDTDGENERFRVVFDTTAAEWPDFDVVTGEAAYAEVIIVDEATYPVAGRWWAGLSQQARERMVEDAASGANWEHLLSQSVSKPFAKMRSENRAHAGALAGELVDAERSGADKVVNLSTPQAWWASLDCRLRRIAVGEGVTADMDSLWCRDWPDGNASGRLTQAQTVTVGDIFEALVGTGAVGGPGQASPQNSEPTAMLLTAVSNVQAVAADDASVTVTWDAVEPATSYTVEYTGTPSDPMNDLDASRVVVSGIENDITGTTTTIRHGATESIAITLTVTPARVDGNGGTQLLRHLAGTVTLEVVIAEPDPPQSECALPDDAITVAEVTGWRDAFPDDADHVLRWNRVLAALGEDIDATPMTAAEAQTINNQFNNDRWDRTTRTLEAMAQCANPAPTPEISIAAAGSITEGGAATFTITADPAPAADLDVAVSVSQSGDFGATTGAQTVTIPTTGSYALTVATTNDSADEADGSVTVTVDSGTGYTVSSGSEAATVAVADDDMPEISIAAGSGVTEGGEATFTLTAIPTPHAALSVSVSVSQSGDYGVATGLQTVTIPTTGSYALTVATTNDSADEADGSVTATVDSGTGYTVSTTSRAATVAVADDDMPEISIAAGNGVTEGGKATFTLTATPTPHAALSVSVSVSQSGDYGVATGLQTVTIPTTGSYALTVATTNDSTDEADGSVTATVNGGNGYTVSSGSGAATVAVSDDDDAPPISLPSLTISDGQEREDNLLMEFHLELSEASDREITVTIEVVEGTATWGGDYQINYTTTHTIDPGETRKTFYVALRDDDHPEDDETFQLKVISATGATIADAIGQGVIVDDD